jgi:hypothetical protein
MLIYIHTNVHMYVTYTYLRGCRNVFGLGEDSTLWLGLYGLQDALVEAAEASVSTSASASLHTLHRDEGMGAGPAGRGADEDVDRKLKVDITSLSEVSRTRRVHERNSRQDDDKGSREVGSPDGYTDVTTLQWQWSHVNSADGVTGVIDDDGGDQMHSEGDDDIDRQSRVNPSHPGTYQAIINEKATEILRAMYLKARNVQHLSSASNLLSVADILGTAGGNDGDGVGIRENDGFEGVRSFSVTDKSVDAPDLGIEYSGDDLRESMSGKVVTDSKTNVDISASMSQYPPTSPPSLRILRVVDKMLANYKNIGLIHLLYPQAVILHTHRDPIDTLFSCMHIRFASPAAVWTLDVDTMVEEYVAYLEIMHHFRQQLPGRVVDVSYEALLARPERTMRAILDLLEVCAIM